jgi:AraC-like DNA-binding protein
MKFVYPRKDWRGIAWDCGYYDYQHLVRDYKEFAGVTPNSIFHLDDQAPERHFGWRDYSEE